jgi:hypothetical protein
VPSPSHRHRITTFLVVVFLLLGSLQLIPAVLEAATDTTGNLGRHWVVTQYIISQYPLVDHDTAEECGRRRNRGNFSIPPD